jgi:hypothetical protein
MNSLEISELGRKVSQDFTERAIPMTDSLVKIAKEQQLTKVQLQRVAEEANNTSYLKLVKTASDAYVEFPVGNFQEAWDKVNTLEKKASVALDSEYANIVKQDFDYIEKVASEYIDPKIEILNKHEIDEKSEYLKSNIQRLENIFFEKNASFEKDVRELVDMVKQGMASKEVDYADVKTVVKAVTTLHTQILTDLDNNLQPFFPFEELTKVAGYTPDYTKINIQSPLVKKIKDIEKIAFDVEETLYLMNSQEEELSKLGGVGGKVVKWGAIASLPLAAYFLGRHLERNSLARKNLELTPEMIRGIQASQSQLRKTGL